MFQKVDTSQANPLADIYFPVKIVFPLNVYSNNSLKVLESLARDQRIIRVNYSRGHQDRDCV